MDDESRPKRRRRVTPAAGASRFPRAWVVSSAPGRLRADTPGRPYDRSAGNIARCTVDGRERGKPVPTSPVPGSASLELSGDVRSLPQVPGWNADTRARPLRRFGGRIV